MIEKSSNLIHDIDIQELTTMIFSQYGYDFSDYSKASFKRRIINVMNTHKTHNIVELHYRIKNDRIFFNDFLNEITVNVTEMFRDPNFYKVLRNEIIPQLKTYPFIRIWHAGCSTGEEVYSMAILLKEEGLLDRSILYATDISLEVLEAAKSGIFPLSRMKENTENYILSGGLVDFSEYYVAKYEKALFNEELKKNMVFSHHNLSFDKSFNEFNLILCRNVLIYFNKDLRNKVINLFHESLSPLGYLALGNNESFKCTSTNSSLDLISRKQKIWQRKK